MVRQISRAARMGISGRILAIGAVGIAAAVLVGVSAAVNAADVAASISQVTVLAKVKDSVQEIRMYNSDVTGWQVAYAADPYGSG